MNDVFSICPNVAEMLPSRLPLQLANLDAQIWSILVDGKDFVGVTLEDSC